MPAELGDLRRGGVGGLPGLLGVDEHAARRLGDVRRALEERLHGAAHLLDAARLKRGGGLLLLRGRVGLRGGARQALRRRGDLVDHEALGLNHPVEGVGDLPLNLHVRGEIPRGHDVGGRREAAERAQHPIEGRGHAPDLVAPGDLEVGLGEIALGDAERGLRHPVDRPHEIESEGEAREEADAEDDPGHEGDDGAVLALLLIELGEREAEGEAPARAGAGAESASPPRRDRRRTPPRRRRDAPRPRQRARGARPRRRRRRRGGPRRRARPRRRRAAPANPARWRCRRTRARGRPRRRAPSTCRPRAARRRGARSRRGAPGKRG